MERETEVYIVSRIKLVEKQNDNLTKALLAKDNEIRHLQCEIDNLTADERFYHVVNKECEIITDLKNETLTIKKDGTAITLDVCRNDLQIIKGVILR